MVRDERLNVGGHTMKRSTVRLLLLLVLLVFVVPIAAFAAEDNETPPEVNYSTPAAPETTPAPTPAPSQGTGSTEGSTPAQQPATPTGTTPAETPAAPSGTTPAETPATPTGTTPGETPAAPTGTTPGEPPATPTGTTPGETPATTDGTTPEDKPDAAEEDEENPEPAAEKADVEKAKLAGVKKNGAMLGESMNGDGPLLLGAIPDQPNITDRTVVPKRENAVWNEDKWIGASGLVFIQNGSTLTDNGEVKNTSTHNELGPTNHCIAFIVGQYSTLNLKNTVTSSNPSGVAFGWAGSTINIFGKLISANADADWDKKYIVKTAGGTILLGNGATIENYKNAQFGCVQYPDDSRLLVEGTATIKNSSLTVTQTPLELQPGANLVLENSSLDLDGSKIIVRDGTSLTLTRDSSVKDNMIKVESGGKLILNGASVASSVAEFMSGALLELQNGASFEVEADKTLNLGGVEVTSGANNTNNTNTITGTGTGTGTLDLLVDNENKKINIGSGAGLKTQNLTIRNAIINDDTYTADGVKHVNTTINVNPGSTTTLHDNSQMINSTVNVKGNGRLVVNGSTFTTKSSEAGADRIGDKNYINVESGGTLEMTDSVVSGKKNPSVAILVKGTATLTNSTFTNNEHYYDDGGAIRGIGATIQIDNCNFTKNTANRGGAVSMQGGTLEIDKHLSDSDKKSTFENNIATGSSPNTASGGAIYMDGGTLTIGDASTSFSKNSANASGSSGGAIYMNGGTLTVGDGSIFTGNLATGYQAGDKLAPAGGAIMLKGVEAKIGASTFQENGIPQNEDPTSFTMRGGAIYIDAGSKVELKGTKFENNGVFYPADSYASPTSTGGAICIEGKNAILDIKGAQFKNNYSGTTGGALSLLRGSRVTIGALNALNKYTPTKFEGNRVNYGYDFSGGAIFIHDGARLDMENAAISENTADGAGGGIATCWTGSAQVHLLDGAVIYGNTVKNPIEGIDKYVQDIYLLEVVDRKNEKTEELSEQMFNGGLHRWKIKRITGSRNYVNGHQKTNAMVAGSNPTSNKTTKAQVIFTKNSVTAHNHDENGYIAYGGAIACNGELYIGTDKPSESEKELTEIKIVKIWDDKDDTSKRPTDPDTLKSKIYLWNGEEPRSLAAIEKGDVNVNVTVLTGDAAKAVNPYSDAVYGAEEEPEKNDIYNLKTGEWKLVNDTYWVIIVSGLEKLADGKSYKVTEDAVPSYHTKDINGLVITNTLNDVPPTPTGGGGSPSTIKVAVEKKWDDQNDQDKTRPDFVTVRLLADGVDTGKTVTLSASNNWKASFTNLAEKKSGKVITYTVEEETVAGYTASVTGDRKAGFVIENKLTPPETPTPPDEPTPPTPPDEPTPPDTPPDTPTTPDEPTTPDTPTTPDKPTGETEDYGPSDNPSRTTPNGKTPTTGTPPTTGRTPTTGTTSSNGSVPPRTGDESHTALWAALALMSLGGICAVVVNPRKQKR